MHGAKIQDSGLGIGRNHRKYNFVNNSIMEQKPYIITIVGPESSGKSTLARQLATAFGCPWVREYARAYLEGRGGNYDETDLVKIADGQLSVISKQLAVFSNPYSVSGVQSSVGSLLSAVGSVQSSGFPPSPLLGVNNFASLLGTLEMKDVLIFHKEDFGDDPRPIVIIDGGMMSLRMWANIKYNMTIPIVEEALREDVTSMYILCRPVLPWEPDPLREAPLLLDRVWIYNLFLEELFLNQVK